MGLARRSQASRLTCIRLFLDEAHKAYGGNSNKPARIDAWREALAEQDIALVVTAVTATPKWDVRSKAQAGLAKRACTVLGVEVGEFTSNIHHRPLRVR